MDAEMGRTIIEGLGGLVLAGITWYLKTLGSRVERIEEEVRKYETEVGVGHSRMDSLHEIFEKHTKREEAQLSGLVGQFHSISLQLAAVMTRLDGIGSAASTEYARIAVHEREDQDWRQKVVRLEGRIDALENQS